MGRLFWKFFLSILLAQVAATIGIGGTLWLRDQARHRLLARPTAQVQQEPQINRCAAIGRGDTQQSGYATSQRWEFVWIYVLDQIGQDEGAGGCME